jgi:hypothetical protein
MQSAFLTLSTVQELLADILPPQTFLLYQLASKESLLIYRRLSLIRSSLLAPEVLEAGQVIMTSEESAAVVVLVSMEMAGVV